MPVDLDWLEAFRGIPAYPTVGGGPDLTETLARKRSVAAVEDRGVLIHNGALRLVAERIDDLSRALTTALGGEPERPLSALELEAYEAQQAAAEEARSAYNVRAGVIAVDGDKAALYAGTGERVSHGPVEAVRATVSDGSWIVTTLEVPEGAIVADWPLNLPALNGRIKVAERMNAMKAERDGTMDDTVESLPEQRT